MKVGESFCIPFLTFGHASLPFLMRRYVLTFEYVSFLFLMLPYVYAYVLRVVLFLPLFMIGYMRVMRAHWRLVSVHVVLIFARGSCRRRNWPVLACLGSCSRSVRVCGWAL